jgi:Na+/proline symporter
MTTSDEKGAARAIWTNAWMTVPSAFIFFGVGTALYLFYQQFPSELDPNLSRNDAIFPYFMVHELPPGVAGFVVAGIFAAAQPTSSLNSVATAWTTDFFQRFHPAAGPTALVRMGRISTTIAGVLGIVAALILDKYPVESIWELFLNIIGLTTGILAGLFSLGILTTRATGAGAVMGVLISIATLIIVGLTHIVHPLMFGFVGVTSTFIGGYLMSLLGQNNQRDLKGLTIYTINDRAAFGG